MYKTIIAMVVVAIVSGCVGQVKWVDRKGGDPQTEHSVPVCPHCEHVINYRSLQCKNPECRALLRWKSKDIYAKRLYGETPDELVTPTSSPKVVDKNKDEQAKTPKAIEEEKLPEPKSETPEQEFLREQPPAKEQPPTKDNIDLDSEEWANDDW